MKLLYFAWVRDRIGTAEEDVALPDGVATVDDLVAWLRGRSPGHAEAFAELSMIRAAVNHEHVRLDHPVANGDEVAFFPPVTGGSGKSSVRVQREDFDIGAEIEALAGGNTATGAVASFVGLMRDFHGKETLRSMTLEHYPGMTEREIGRIVAEAERRWPLDAVLVVHRYGRLTPGDRIVLVAAASAHRQPALDACGFLIDWLKTRAPFWKKEEGEDGARWVEARSGDDDAARRWSAREN
ncbi:MAG: molybdopterin converting factor subunit 1 [Acetobacterales bacterium]